MDFSWKEGGSLKGQQAAWNKEEVGKEVRREFRRVWAQKNAEKEVLKRKQMIG